VTHYRITPAALVAPLEDGTVILNMRTNRYYSLNETGALVWSMLEQEQPRESIVARLVQTFDVSNADAEQAVAALFRELSAEQLIEIAAR
jgi:Coenzyme PQQ synthesis protein D (PqqD)